MNEIRKALAKVRERIEAHQAYDAIEALDEALSLLPPEGETRQHSFDDIRQAACNIVGACKADVPEDEKIDYADERIRGLFPKPAPSSEKALVTALERIKNRCDRSLALPRGHLCDYYDTVMSCRDRANEALASSPAPSKLKVDDIFPTPEAPKDPALPWQEGNPKAEGVYFVETQDGEYGLLEPGSIDWLIVKHYIGPFEKP